MHGFEPRLLMPGTPGIPAHMAVSHDPRVYEEMRDPAITAAVYVPKWSAPVREAFARIATIAPEQQKSFEDRIVSSAHAIGDIEDFAAENIARWLRPAFKPQAAAENYAVVQEIAQAHAAFTTAANRLLDRNPDRQPFYHPLSRRLNINDEADTRLQPHLPATSLAHTDPGDAGLFSYPLGTVLVDQTGLDIKRLRTADAHAISKGRQPHRIALTHLANRLWQIPEGSFGLWRGEPHANAQFHFFPHIAHDMQRFRAFAHP